MCKKKKKNPLLENNIYNLEKEKRNEIHYKWKTRTIRLRLRIGVQILTSSAAILIVDKYIGNIVISSRF